MLRAPLTAALGLRRKTDGPTMVGTGGSVDCLGYFDGPGHGLGRALLSPAMVAAYFLGHHQVSGEGLSYGRLTGRRGYLVGRSPASKIRTDNEVVSVRDAVWRRRTHFSHAYRTSGVRSPATLPRAAPCDRRRNTGDPSSNGRRQPSVSLELVWSQGRLKGRTDESSLTRLG